MKIKTYSRVYPNLQALVNDINLITNHENTFDITLNTSTTVTTISNQFVGLSSVISMMPTSAAAATEPYYITTGAETFDITHSSGSSTRTFRYFIYG